MEKLVINVPDGKSNIVKQLLHSFGVTISGYDAPIKGEYKKSLLNVTVWSAEDLKQIEDAFKLPIATLNKKHFKLIDGLKILR